MEVADDWLLCNAVNKNINLTQFKKAIELANGFNIKTIANIGLGIPFLSEKATIKATINSVNEAFKIGVDNVILFPYHVKPGTLLEVLYQHNLYHSVSLWSLINVLSSLDKKFLPYVNISWYRNYYTDPSKIISSPITCDKCYQDVLSLLDEFKAKPSEEMLEKLQNFSCSCKLEWIEKIGNQSEKPDIAQFEKMYEFLANAYDIPNTVVEDGRHCLKEDNYA